MSGKEGREVTLTPEDIKTILNGLGYQARYGLPYYYPHEKVDEDTERVVKKMLHARKALTEPSA